jgi:hypothetical protein
MAAESPAAAARALALTTVSGEIVPPKLRPLRSACVTVVRTMVAPPGSGNVSLPVESPAVGVPKERVRARPRKEMATTSPELAVRGPVMTATCADSSGASVGGGSTPG